MTWFVLASTNHPRSLSLSCYCHLSHIISNHCSVALCNYYQGLSHKKEITKSILSCFRDKPLAIITKYLSLMTPMLQGVPHADVNMDNIFMAVSWVTLCWHLCCWSPVHHCQLRQQCQLRCWWPLVPNWQHSCDSIRHSPHSTHALATPLRSMPRSSSYWLVTTRLTASRLTSAFPWCWQWLAAPSVAEAGTVVLLSAFKVSWERAMLCQQNVSISWCDVYRDLTQLLE